MPELRIGVAGLGFGTAVHVPAFQSLPGVKVVVLAGSTYERAQYRAENLGIESACAGFEKLFEYDIDAVSLALPPKQNAEAARIALDRKIPVLCEKPIAADVDIAADLAIYAKDHLAMVDFQFGELTPFRALSHLLKHQVLGSIRHVQVSWLTHSYAQRNKLFNWKVDESRDGGVLNMLGLHFFHLAECLFGTIEGLSARVDSRSTAAFTPPTATPAEDLVHITAELSNGAALQAVIGNASPGGCGHRIEVTCQEGTIVLHNPTEDHAEGFSLMLYRDEGTVEHITLPVEESVGDGRIPPFRSLAARFVAALRNGHTATPDFFASVRAQTLRDATITSAEMSQIYVHTPTRKY